MALDMGMIRRSVGLEAAGFSLSKTGAKVGSGESQDCGMVVECGSQVLAALADGVSQALRGGLAAAEAVGKSQSLFRRGIDDPAALLGSACQHLHGLNVDYMESERSDKLAYQTMLLLVIVGPGGDFRWASVGDSSLEIISFQASECLTTEAEVFAEKRLQRVGLPPDILRIFSGSGILAVGSTLRAYTDGFREWHDDCQGKTLPQMKRLLAGLPLQDDTTLIELKRI